MTNVVTVNYSKRGDWYIATSDQIRGLFVACPNLADAYNEVPQAIQLIFKAKYDMDVDVKESSAAEKSPIDKITYIAETRAA